MDLIDALKSVSGKSPLADYIIQSRFSDMVSESSSVEETTLDDDAKQEIIDAVSKATYNKSGDQAVRELSAVLIDLLDRLALAHESTERDEEDEDEESVNQKLELFRSSLQGARIGDLKCYYTPERLKSMQQSTRASVAVELVNYSTQNGKEPAYIWSLLAQNNGQM